MSRCTRAARPSTNLPLLLILAVGLAAPWPARAASSPERCTLVLLPVRDRAGDPEVADRVQARLRSELSGTHRMPETEVVRDALRVRRLRDSGAIPPRSLADLAEGLGCGSFLSVTLHHTDRKAVPQMTLSGRLTVAGRPTLAWAGFHAASGIDGLIWLGRGRVDDILELSDICVRGLLDDLETVPSRPRVRRGESREFLRSPDLGGELGMIGVLPFESVAEGEGVRSSETITALALATLSRSGVSLALPGAVTAALRREGFVHGGELTPGARARVRAEAGASHLFTGAVEAFRIRPRAADVEPLVAFSARLLEAGSGRVVWTGSDEKSGWENEGWFQRRRVRSLGRLAESSMASLVAGFIESGRGRDIDG